jgi:glycosyltransferase involved in cell wall biosynthesis
MITLSILIPTLPERAEYLARLMAILTPQLTMEVEVLTDERPRGVTTGEKRNWLLSQAKGIYSVFIDDDDLVSNTYVADVLGHAKHRCDCVTFRGFMTTNGRSLVNFVIRLGEAYEERGGVYYRFPNHITPIKTEIARSVQFPHKVMGEDYEWAKKINDLGLLKTESHIDEEMYHYDYRTQK